MIVSLLAVAQKVIYDRFEETLSIIGVVEEIAAESLPFKLPVVYVVAYFDLEPRELQELEGSDQALALSTLIKFKINDQILLEQRGEIVFRKGHQRHRLVANFRDLTISKEDTLELIVESNNIQVGQYSIRVRKG